MSEIVARNRPEVAAAKKQFPASELELSCRALPPRASMVAALQQPGVRIIAEIKRASPSRGVICHDFQPVDRAVSYARGGAAAISVLTEPHYFQGNLEHLRAVSEAVSLPLLRKDFIFDVYQLLQARYYGASAVLLIAAMLPPSQFLELTLAAHELGLEVLGEIHNQSELDMVMQMPVNMIGVNARDLRTFNTSLNEAEKLLRQIPAGRLPIAESAIKSPADLQCLQQAGAAGFLIGETLMRAVSPEAELRRLICLNC